MQTDAQKIAADLEKSKGSQEIEKERISSQERIAGAQIGFKAASENAKLSSKETIEGVKIGKEIVETLFEDNKE